jgi:flagellar biosynthesis chaperone FliJ
VQYRKRLSDNEARLSLGVTARGEPLTAEQIETLGQIVDMQRSKLAELMANGR